MSTILKLTSSLNSAGGQSSQLATELVGRLRKLRPGSRVIERDLVREPVPHLDGDRFQAFATPAEKRSPEQQAVAAYSDALIGELRAADVLVLAVPMYNFGVSSHFKAWVDHVARSGLTFRYTDKGPVGLLTGKKAYVIATRGGAYAGTRADTQTDWLRQILAFIGITDVEFVYAERLALGDEPRRASLAQARAAFERVASPAALAA